MVATGAEAFPSAETVTKMFSDDTRAPGVIVKVIGDDWTGAAGLPAPSGADSVQVTVSGDCPSADTSHPGPTTMEAPAGTTTVTTGSPTVAAPSLRTETEDVDGWPDTRDGDTVMTGTRALVVVAVVVELDAAEIPAPLTATTLNVYAVCFVSPLIEQLVVLVLQLKAPVDEVTV